MSLEFFFNEKMCNAKLCWGSKIKDDSWVVFGLEENNVNVIFNQLFHPKDNDNLTSQFPNHEDQN